MSSSKLRWISNAVIDRQKWDLCIDNCVWGKVYALSWFLDLITENQWEALVVGDYDFIMPVPFRKKYGIRYTYRPNFCQQLGVFAKESNLDPLLLEKFIQELLLKYKHIHYPLNHANIGFESNKVHLKKRTNLVLDLDGTYQTIFENYSGNLKKNLQKAEKANLIMGNNVEADEIITSYKNAWQSLNQIPESDYLNFKKIIDFGDKKGISEKLAVSRNNEILACCFLLKYKNRLYYPFSSVTSDGRKYAATAFLINNIVQQYANSDHLFDFEGSDIESVKSFYSKFGPEREYYYHCLLYTSDAADE